MDKQKALDVLRSWHDVDLNEADTRHQLIDILLHDILDWPRSRTKCEKHINGGYADYSLAHRSGDVAFVIEAKRTGDTFQLPLDQNSSKNSRFIPLQQLLTDESTEKAISQVQKYATDLGCEFACATNGHQWIIFRAFARGKNWKRTRAFVIQSLSWFEDDFSDASNKLSFEAIEKHRSLTTLLTSGLGANREIYYPKERITNFSASVTTNRFAKYLRPMSGKYFQNLEDAGEDRFFEDCYVRQREYDSAFDGLSGIIKDSLTPYMEEYGIQQTEDNEKGGRLGNRIIRSLQDSKSADVVVLFGGKGIGKSTFLRRLLVVKSPQFLSKHAVVLRIDLLNEPDSPDALSQKFWTSLVKELDVDRLLVADRETLLELFADRYEIAKRQTLVGFPEESIEYNQSLNALVEMWKADLEYCAERLSAYWKLQHRGIVVVVDNTDQFKGETQDYCFTLAQQIAMRLKCLSLISMREERFQRSRVHGVLDAFQNSGFHLSAPLPHQVFLRRLKFVRTLLCDQQRLQQAIPALNFESAEREDLIHFLSTLINEFEKGLKSPLYMFLVACAHGNIRLALELFRGFIVSGYTNIGEIVDVKPGFWTLRIHQVVRPIMTPHRFFYEESDSPIPNLYRLRSNIRGSHFTSIRILKRLSFGSDPNNSHFVSVADLRDIFSSGYELAEDFNGGLDMLLSYSLVEANNRIDEYSDEIDSVRITQYGVYILDSLLFEFTYLDMACTDCGVYSQQAASNLAELSNQDYRLFRNHNKFERIKARISKVRCFLSYLKEQEQWEIDNLNIAEKDLVVDDLTMRFESTVPDIERSAKRNL